MLGKNVPTKFETLKGSTYEIFEDRMIRRKYDGTKHENPKNIFYTTEETSKNLAGLRKDEDYSVEINNDQAIFTFSSSREKIVTQRTPEKGAYPVDMLLTKEGKPDPKGDRFHRGHKIKNIETIG